MTTIDYRWLWFMSVELRPCIFVTTVFCVIRYPISWLHWRISSAPKPVCRNVKVLCDWCAVMYCKIVEGGASEHNLYGTIRVMVKVTATSVQAPDKKGKHRTRLNDVTGVIGYKCNSAALSLFYSHLQRCFNTPIVRSTRHRVFRCHRLNRRCGAVIGASYGRKRYGFCW